MTTLLTDTCFVYCTEPTSAPLEVTAVAIGSQTLQVSWKVSSRHALYQTISFNRIHVLALFFMFPQ